MTNEIDKECPSCGVDLEIKAPQWDSKAICPNCNAGLYVEYDEIVTDDDSYDTYELKVLDESNDYKSLEFSEVSVF